MAILTLLSSKFETWASKGNHTPTHEQLISSVLKPCSELRSHNNYYWLYSIADTQHNSNAVYSTNSNELKNDGLSHVIAKLSLHFSWWARMLISTLDSDYWTSVEFTTAAKSIPTSLNIFYQNSEGLRLLPADIKLSTAKELSNMCGVSSKRP